MFNKAFSYFNMSSKSQSYMYISSQCHLSIPLNRGPIPKYNTSMSNIPATHIGHEQGESSWFLSSSSELGLVVSYSNRFPILCFSDCAKQISASLTFSFIFSCQSKIEPPRQFLANGHYWWAQTQRLDVRVKVRKDWNLCFWISKQTQSISWKHCQRHTTRLYDHASCSKHSTNVNCQLSICKCYVFTLITSQSWSCKLSLEVSLIEGLDVRTVVYWT